MPKSSGGERRRRGLPWSVVDGDAGERVGVVFVGGQSAPRGPFPRSSRTRTRGWALDGGLQTIRRRRPRHRTNIPQDRLIAGFTHTSAGPERHLIRPHHHTLTHDQPPRPTSRCHAEQQTTDQHHDQFRLRGIALTSIDASTFSTTGTFRSIVPQAPVREVRTGATSR